MGHYWDSKVDYRVDFIAPSQLIVIFVQGEHREGRLSQLACGEGREQQPPAHEERDTREARETRRGVGEDAAPTDSVLH